MQAEERYLKERTPGRRYFQLDALRGIAALCVVFYHCNRAFQSGPVHFWAIPFLSGTQAVDLFFVLSGFVLSLPYLEGKRRPYPPYLVRRFWRIYVPFAAAVFFSAAGAMVFRGYHLPLTQWYYVTWQTPVTVSLVAQQLLMVPLSSLNTAFWSLSVEVQLSILMPFIAIAVRRLPAALSLAVLALWVISWMPAQSAWRTLLPTLPFIQFGPLFLLGSILAKYQSALTTATRSRRGLAWLVLFVSVLLYCNFKRSDWRMYSFLDQNQAIITGLGGAGLILSALGIPGLARLLEHRVPEYLGRVSYSLYLTHSVVLFAMLDLFYGRIPMPWLIGAIFVVALAVAHVFCIAIEEPSNRLGKRLSSAESRSEWLARKAELTRS